MKERKTNLGKKERKENIPQHQIGGF